MSPDTLRVLFEVSGMIAQHIWQAIENGDEKELRRLAEVWPAPIATKIALMKVEEKIYRRVKEDS